MFKFFATLLSVLILILIILKVSFYSRKLEISAEKPQRDFYQKEIILGGKTFFVDIAEKNLDRARGLSGRDGLGVNQGMLFIFEHADKYPFWMKGMLFGIDFIWIKDNKIIEFSKNAMPKEGIVPKIYFPSQPADMVLEIAAGGSDVHGLKIGDELQIR